VQGAKVDHRPCHWQASGIETLAAAVEYILYICLTERLLHQPVGYRINQYGTSGAFGLIIHIADLQSH
jgi:hypothetical protein